MEGKYIYYVQKSNYPRVIKHHVSDAEFDKLLNEPESDWCADFESAKDAVLWLINAQLAGINIWKLKFEASKEEDLIIIPMILDDIFDKK